MDSVTRFFAYVFFRESSFPKASDNSIRVISNFFENSRRYLQIKVHQPVATTPAANLQPIPLVSLIQAAILLPVSLIPVVHLDLRIDDSLFLRYCTM